MDKTLVSSTSKTVGVGKLRALGRTSAPPNVFTILALDHQDALRRALNPSAPQTVTTEALTAFKLDVLEALSPHASGVLLDPKHGAPQAVAAGLLNQIGLLLELEWSDYQLEPLPLEIVIHPNWNVEKIKRMGADGVKLFFYYHPEDRAHAAAQEAVLRGVAAECERWDVPLYAEPILYSLPGADAIPAADRTRLVIESARRTEACGADILKLEFPVDVAQMPDEAHWMEACTQLTGATRLPWTLLSAGVDYATFARQVEIACKAGASGFIAGRSVWGDACTFTERDARRDWLRDEGRRRMQHLSECARTYGAHWTDKLKTESITTEWFITY